MGKMKMQSGFTLIEVLVTVALFGMLSLAIGNVFLATIRGSDQARAEAELRAQGDRITTTIERNLRMAISLPVLTDNTLSYQTGADEEHSFSFDNNEITFDGNQLIQNSAGLGITYPETGRIVIQSNDGPNPGFVVIKFNLTATKGKSVISQSFTARVVMRNLK